MSKSTFVLIFFSLLVLGGKTFAQPAEGNVFVITNFEAAFAQDGSVVEFDSLTTEYNKWCYAKNEYVVSYKTVRHWWGNNNRDIVSIIEVKNWEDIINANEKANELFEEHWSTTEMRKTFNDTYNKYFTGKHSDEIYREIVFE